MQPTTLTPRQEAFVAEMTQRMADVARRLSAWASEEVRTLGDLEQYVVRLGKELGNALLAGVCQLAAPAVPARQIACACGRVATYQRWRPAQVLTVLGPITVQRPYYTCAHCHQGSAPLDEQLALCAGSSSAGLDELLALLGATEDSFEAAAAVLDKLTLVQVCPNLARMATERLGQLLHVVEQQAVAAAWADGAVPTPAATTPAPARLYVSMDGVLVHTYDGWKEYKLGTVYTTVAQASRHRPEELRIRAQDASFVGDFAEPQPFGQALWCEAKRRGVLGATEVVVLGDGAHWIWNLAAEHFPEALQIVDWYHATQYLWQVASAVYGEGTDLAKQWAGARLDELWEGQVEAVLHAFQVHRHAGKPVEEAITYYTNNRERMRYADYRARGIQIGSGAIESGCNHVIGARLKQAGMIWQVAGARAVATVRTWLKSGRWEEAMALRPPRHRAYQRQAA
jgi:hypothetical protein